MQNPYNKYQNQQKDLKKAKKTQKASSAPLVTKKVKPVNRTMAKGKKASSASFSLMIVLGSLAGILTCFYVLDHAEQIIDVAGRIKLGFSSVMAEDVAKSSAKDSKKEEKSDTLPVGSSSEILVSDESLTMKNASVYNALESKQKELEKKERDLALLEEDLQRQKLEIEKQLNEMKEMRRNISSKLETKLVADQESVDKLVGFYTNMKPQNAATIISQLDEDLAVKVLSHMKKQSAAAILNFVEPKKAQVLSEKYAGLKR